MKGKKENNIIIKVIKNEYLTYFVGFFTILFVMEILNSPSNNFIILLKYFLNSKLIMIISVLLIILIGYFNISLSFLLLLNLFFLMNIKLKVETFSNRIPDLVDKNTLVSYKKNFGKVKEAKKNAEQVQLKNKKLKQEKIQNKKLEQEKIPKKRKLVNKVNKKEQESKIIQHFDESKNIVNNERLKEYDIKGELEKVKNKQMENKNKDKTIEEELVSKNYEIKKDLEILEMDDSSESSESSESEDSSESSASSDSDEVDDVSMDEAREHVMKKIRNRIKKKYKAKK